MRVNTPYKSANVASIHATNATFVYTSESAALVSGDVGRFIVFNRGDAQNQIRRITAINTTTKTITVTHRWDSKTNPEISESNPSVGDTFYISYDINDLISANEDITQDDNNHIVVRNEQSSDGIEVESNAYIHFKNKRITWDSADVQIHEGAGLIFGDYDYVAGERAVNFDYSRISDTRSGTAGEQMRADSGESAATFGGIWMFGGSINALGTSSLFYRMYNGTSNTSIDSTLNPHVYFSQVYVNSHWGSRIEGNKLFFDVIATAAESTVGVCNPLATSGGFISIQALGCDQAIYIWTAAAAEGSAKLSRLSDVGNYVIRYVRGSTVTDSVYNVEAKINEINNAPVFISRQGSVSAASTGNFVRVGNYIQPTFLDATNAVITQEIKTQLEDTNGTSVNTQTITDGSFTRYFARHTDVNPIRNTSADATTANLSDGTSYGPYTLYSMSYGKVLTSSILNVEDTHDENIILLDNSDISETDQTTVDAYTALDTAEKLYDYYNSWQVDNLDDRRDFSISDSRFITNNTAIKMATDYSNAISYAVGDVTYQNSRIYECNTAITEGESFTASKWTQIVQGIFFINSTAIYLYYGDSFTGGMDAGSGAVTIRFDADISGSVISESNVEVRINLPNVSNTHVYGYYLDSSDSRVYSSSGGQSFPDTAFRWNVPADTDIKISVAPRGYYPRYLEYNSGDGLIVTPEFTRYVNDLPDTDPAWTSDVTPFCNILADNPPLILTFNSVSNLTNNRLGDLDMVSFMDVIHQSNAYACHLLQWEDDGLITDSANNVMELNKASGYSQDPDIYFEVADGLNEFVTLGFVINYDTDDVNLDTSSAGRINDENKVVIVANANTVKYFSDSVVREIVTEVVEANAVDIDNTAIATEVWNHDIETNRSASTVLTQIEDRTDLLPEIEHEVDILKRDTQDIEIYRAQIRDQGPFPRAGGLIGYSNTYGSFVDGNATLNIFGVDMTITAMVIQGNDDVDNFSIFSPQITAANGFTDGVGGVRIDMEDGEVHVLKDGTTYILDMGDARVDILGGFMVWTDLTSANGYEGLTTINNLQLANLFGIYFTVSIYESAQHHIAQAQRAMQADVAAIMTETDKIPATITKIDSIKTETDKIPDISNEVKLLPAIKSQVERVNEIFTDTEHYSVSFHDTQANAQGQIGYSDGHFGNITHGSLTTSIFPFSMTFNTIEFQHVAADGVNNFALFSDDITTTNGFSSSGAPDAVANAIFEIVTSAGTLRLRGSDATIQLLGASMIWGGISTDFTNPDTTFGYNATLNIYTDEEYDIASDVKAIKDDTNAISTLPHDVWSYDINTIPDGAGNKVCTIDTNVSNLPSAADNADAIWNADLDDHQTDGSAGKKLDDLTNSETQHTLSDIADAVMQYQIDGLNFDDIIKKMNSITSARLNISENTYTYYDEEGNVYLSYTVDENGRTKIVT